MASGAAAYAHAWYGEVSDESPLLSFACFPDAGVYLSICRNGKSIIHVASSDFGVSYLMEWGQDTVRIPRAYLTPLLEARQIVQHFCSDGSIAKSPKWRPLDALEWDMWDV